MIPCCTDVDRFANAARADLGAGDRTVYVYSGSLGGYYSVEEIARLLRADPRAFVLVLTQSNPGPMIEALRRAGFSRDEFRVLSVPPEDVPRYLRAADAGVSLILQSPARRASSPTKFAEYLAAGLPVIHSAGIGDLDAQIEQHRVGVLVRSFDDASCAETIRAMTELRRDPETATRCRTLARSEYDLHDVGGARYRRLYDAVLRA
jgi:glycosyltransferase involved in cell wall biosynthesis